MCAERGAPTPGTGKSGHACLHLTEANVPGIRSVESKTFCHLNDPEHVRRVQMLTGSDRQSRFWRCYKMELKQPLPTVGQVCVAMSVCVDAHRMVTRIGASPIQALSGVTVNARRERKGKKRRGGVFKSRLKPWKSDSANSCCDPFPPPALIALWMRGTNYRGDPTDGLGIFKNILFSINNPFQKYN